MGAFTYQPRQPWAGKWKQRNESGGPESLKTLRRTIWLWNMITYPNWRGGKGETLNPPSNKDPNWNMINVPAGVLKAPPCQALCFQAKGHMNNTITDVGCILGQSKIEGETQILSCLRSSKKTNMSIFPTSVLKKAFYS